MIEIARSYHVFELTLIQQKLEEAAIGSVILDEHSGGVMVGIGDVSPRLMVLDEDVEAAREIMAAVQNTQD